MKNKMTVIYAIIAYNGIDAKVIKAYRSLRDAEEMLQRLQADASDGMSYTINEYVVI